MSAPAPEGQAPAAAPVGAPAAAPGAAPGQKDDYGDKAAAAIQKKAGLDPNKNKKITEKITDTIRKQIEKFTGKKVPEKISN